MIRTSTAWKLVGIALIIGFVFGVWVSHRAAPDVPRFTPVTSSPVR